MNDFPAEFYKNFMGLGSPSTSSSTQGSTPLNPMNYPFNLWSLMATQNINFASSSGIAQTPELSDGQSTVMDMLNQSKLGDQMERSPVPLGSSDRQSLEVDKKEPNGDREASIEARSENAHSNRAKSPDRETRLNNEISIDTRDLCRRITAEMKTHGIIQSDFALKVLNRGQGTLSELLRNPKPWDKLQGNGQEPYRAMYNWINQPLAERLAIIHEEKEEETVEEVERKRKSTFKGQYTKRFRLVFTEVQKRVLQEVYKDYQQPSNKLMNEIAEQLHLDFNTVHNYFKNTRRRAGKTKSVVQDDTHSDVSDNE